MHLGSPLLGLPEQALASSNFDPDKQTLFTWSENPLAENRREAGGPGPPACHRLVVLVLSPVVAGPGERRGCTVRWLGQHPEWPFLR